jgi:hypothetical protein
VLGLQKENLFQHASGVIKKQWLYSWFLYIMDLWI